MTKKPKKATEADAPEPVPAPVEAVAPEADLTVDAVPAADGIDDGGIEAEEPVDEPEAEATEAEAAQADPAPVGADPVAEEGNQPDAQQELTDQGGDTPNADQLVTDPDQTPDPTPDLEPAVDPVEQLQHLAKLISDMLAWHRSLLITRLVLDHGMQIDRSIEGTRIEMAGITVSVAAMGPGGEHQALDNWANAARRQILELQAAQNA
ncbi:hypothetical protein SAMN04244548_02993 [Paracoccus pantotrophus]|nr:hypothetical protein SAMN04244548_02993 [Paracoccus pantotrophus]